jgi:Outer membrane protein beta-barrel domain
MRRFANALLVCTCALLPAAVGAQACVGAASFSSGPMRLGAGLTISDGLKTYGAQFGVGAEVGPFGSASLSRAEYDNASEAGVVLGLNAGYAIDLTPTKNVQFCPVAGFAYQSGPNVQSTFGDVSASAHAIGFGGSFGGIVPMSPTFDFVPFAGASYLVSQTSVSIGGNSGSVSENHGEVNVGAGFVLNRTLTLQPSVSIPVGVDNAKTSFQIAFAFNFGSSPARK